MFIPSPACFHIPEEELSLMSMEVRTHRLGVLYQADVTYETADKVLDLLDKDKRVEALKVLKEQATEVSVMKTPGAVRKWRMINRAPDDHA